MRTAVRRDSRRLQAQALDGGRERARQLRRRREILSLHLPALGADALLLLEPLPFQQVEPTIGSCVDEELEMRIERQLILRREDRELDAAVAGEEDLELRDLLTNIGERDALSLPTLRAAQVLDDDVHGRRELLTERVEQIDDALRVRHDVRR